MITSRGLWLFFAFLILVVPFSSSITSDMQAEYSQDETVVVKISGNILEPISKEQVEFKKENVRVPFSYDIKKLGDGKYYLWFVTPSNVEKQNNSQNYTLLIKGISTTLNGLTTKLNFSQNFSVSGKFSDYYIEPGFVFTKEDFKIDVTLNRDDDTNIDIDFPYQHTITLAPGKNTINFPIKDLSGTAFLLLKVGQYTFPAYIIKNQSEVVKSRYIDVLPFRIDAVRSFNDDNLYYQFNVKNIWQKNIDNLYVQYNNSIFSLTPDNKRRLGINETASYNIQLKSTSNKNIHEIIYIKSDENNISYAMPIEVIYMSNVSALNSSAGTGNNVSDGLYTCSELLGKVCSAQEECSGETQVSKDGICCKGTCKQANQSSSKAWIGYLIAAIVLIGVIFIYFKYKGVKNDKNPIKTAADSDKKKAIP